MPSTPLSPVVTRAEWGSTVPQKSATLNAPLDYVFVHHTAGHWNTARNLEECSQHMRGIQQFHVHDRMWDDIGYSFLIGGDGRIYEGRGWGRVGAHTFTYNSVGYGISLMGNFCTESPPEPMLLALSQIIAIGVEQGHISHDYGLYGHMDARVTECPGMAFYNTLKSWDRWHAKGVIKQFPAASQ